MYFLSSFNKFALTSVICIQGILTHDAQGNHLSVGILNHDELTYWAVFPVPVLWALPLQPTGVASGALFLLCTPVSLPGSHVQG